MSGGKLNFDAAFSKCLGGLELRDDLRAKLAAISIEPIGCAEKGPSRFGASKGVYGVKAALTPCSVRGKAFAVRTKHAQSAVPG